jgi:putative hydrolase of the HAD superfamily
MSQIRAVFFDAGDTLIHQWAPKAERFEWLCQQAVIPLPGDPAMRMAGAIAVERFFQNRQNHPDAKTPAWFRRMAEEGLGAMGLSRALAPQLLKAMSALPPTQVVDPDAVPVLQRLRARGYRLAIVSNWDGTLLDEIRAAGLAGYFDTVLDSTVVGSRKPETRMFEIACAVTGVDPAEAVHVGDSPGADLVGALAAGIRPVLLDSLDVFPAESLPGPCVRIRRLPELLEVLGLTVDIERKR